MKRPGMHRNETETYKVSGTRGFEDDIYQKASNSIVVCTHWDIEWLFFFLDQFEDLLKTANQGSYQKV